MRPKFTDIPWQQERSWLGYGGLFPFFGGVALLLITDDPAWSAIALDSLRYYAAVIASFLGAVHWGVLTTDVNRRTAHLRWGVLPALIAWVLLLIPSNLALLGFALLFAAILLVDWRILPLLDSDYRRLRLHLSFLVIVALLIAAFSATQVKA